MIAETDLEIVGIDMLNESDLLTGGGAEVEIEIIVTGETTLMKGLEDAARTLLTRGPAAEARVMSGNQQAGLKALSQQRLRNLLPLPLKQRRTRRPSASQS